MVVRFLLFEIVQYGPRLHKRHEEKGKPDLKKKKKTDLKTLNGISWPGTQSVQLLKPSHNPNGGLQAKAIQKSRWNYGKRKLTLDLRTAQGSDFPQKCTYIGNSIWQPPETASKTGHICIVFFKNS